MFRRILTVFAIVYICWYTTSISLLSLVKCEEAAKLKIFISNQKEAEEYTGVLVKAHERKYYRFLVQFTEPPKNVKLPFEQWWIKTGIDDTLLKDLASPVYEIGIGSETMSQEQVREALLNWKLVVRVFTYREMLNATFPPVE